MRHVTAKELVLNGVPLAVARTRYHQLRPASRLPRGRCVTGCCNRKIATGEVIHTLEQALQEQLVLELKIVPQGTIKAVKILSCPCRNKGRARESARRRPAK